MKYRVAVVGGGPSGACAAEALTKSGNIEAFMFERKMDNCKPCGGAIPVCMVEEFGLPTEIIDRKVRKMKLISPTNREVDIGQTLKENEYIGMCRREVMDAYLRDRAISMGVNPVNALVTQIDEIPGGKGYTIEYANSDGTKEKQEFDYIIGLMEPTLEWPRPWELVSTTMLLPSRSASACLTRRCSSTRNWPRCT